MPEPVKDDGTDEVKEVGAADDEEKDLPPAAPVAPPAAPPAAKEVDDPFNIPEAPSSAPRPSSFSESKGGADEDYDAPPPVFKPTAPTPAPAPAPVSAPAPAKSSWFGSKKGSSSSVSKEAIADAIELSKFAVAALEGKEVEVAKQRLQQALACLK